MKLTESTTPSSTTLWTSSGNMAEKVAPRTVPYEKLQRLLVPDVTGKKLAKTHPQYCIPLLASPSASKMLTMSLATNAVLTALNNF